MRVGYRVGGGVVVASARVVLDNGKSSNEEGLRARVQIGVRGAIDEVRRGVRRAAGGGV